MKERLIIYGAVIGIIVLIAITSHGCTWDGERNKATRALQAYGFTNIELGESHYPWVGGGQGDTTVFNAWVTNTAGKRVQVDVYMGIWKDATIRIK